VTAAVALLLPLLGSDASLLMVALLLITVRSGTLASTLVKTVMVAEPAVAIDPIVHVSGCSEFPGMPAVHDPTLGVTVSTLTSAGRVSFTTTLLAEDGPALLTAMVYVTLVPATTGLGFAVLLIARSAEAKKLTPAVAELLLATGSGVVLLTVAVSLISPGSLLVKATRIVVPPPAATVRRLHVTVADVVLPIEVVQDAAAPVTDVTVKLALLTMASVTTTFCASDTPRLATWMSQKAEDPARAGASGLHVFVSAISADSVTSVLAVAVLLRESGSN
jgi:hypothetical protein